MQNPFRTVTSELRLSIASNLSRNLLPMTWRGLQDKFNLNFNRAQDTLFRKLRGRPDAYRWRAYDSRWWDPEWKWRAVYNELNSMMYGITGNAGVAASLASGESYHWDRGGIGNQPARAFHDILGGDAWPKMRPPGEIIDLFYNFFRQLAVGENPTFTTFMEFMADPVQSSEQGSVWGGSEYDWDATPNWDAAESVSEELAY